MNINTKNYFVKCLRRLLILSLFATSIVPAGMARTVGASSAFELNYWTDGFERADSNDIGNGWEEWRGDWSIISNTLRTTGGSVDQVIVQSGIELGKTFDIKATLQNTDYWRWNGVAFNIVDNGDGTQNYYALRMVTYPASAQRSAAWQLLQVTNSTNLSAILTGAVPVEVGKDYTVRVSSSSYGVVDISISDGENKLLERSEVVPLDKLLVGGKAGFYSAQGNLQVNDVHLTTSTEPAVELVSAPLVGTPAEGTGQTPQLPDAQEIIVEKSVVDTTWAGHPVGQSLLTHGDDQYVAYYKADRQMVVAHRKIDEAVWERQPLDTSVGWDSHNSVTMAVDRSGQLHVSGNMHDVPLIYYRTTIAGDVTTLTRVANMVDPVTEQKVTYPFFTKLSDGSLVFRHRDGVSGSGVDFYNVYDEETKEWRRLIEQPLHDGEGKRSAYVDAPRLGPDGYYHMSWVWRDSANAATNQRLSYARSQDLVNWENSDGTPLSLPITYSTGEVIDSVPMNGGILNGNTKIGFDAQGRVVVSYHKYDQLGNTQIYIARFINNGWQISQISDWTGRWVIWGGGSLIAEVTVGRVSALPDGNLRLNFSVHGVQRTWVLSPDSLQPIAEMDTPKPPSELTNVRSDFAGMEVQLGADLGASGNGQERYMLRWESLPQNRDQPRPGPLPEPTPLEVYRLRVASEPNPNLNWTDGFERADSNDIGNGWEEWRGDWSITSNTLRTTGGSADQVIVQSGIELGKTFDIKATLQNTDYWRWNGVAFNIVDNGDGTQNYYALRMVTYPASDQRSAAWQLLQVTNSTNLSAIVTKAVPVEVGKDYTVRVSSSSYGVVDISISDGENKLLERSEVLPLDKLLVGGKAGFYSAQGNLQVNDVHLTTSTEPAVELVSAPLVGTP